MSVYLFNPLLSSEVRFAFAKLTFGRFFLNAVYLFGPLLLSLPNAWHWIGHDLALEIARPAGLLDSGGKMGLRSWRVRQGDHFTAGRTRIHPILCALVSEFSSDFNGYKVLRDTYIPGNSSDTRRPGTRII